MTLGNYKIVVPSNVKSFKFGSTAWTESDLSSSSNALDTSFASNNTTVLLDLVGDADTENPTKSYPFAKDIKISDVEKKVKKEDLLGDDSTGSQNSEIVSEGTEMIEVELTLVYRNSNPSSIFNSTTKCALMEIDNSESSGTGVKNFAFNNIIVTKAGGLTINNSGSAEQKISFVLRGGEAGSPISVTQTSPSETWRRIRLGSDYAMEDRLT